MEKERPAIMTIICLFTLIISVIYIVANFSYVLNVWTILIDTKKTFKVRLLFERHLIFMLFFSFQFFAALIMLFGSKFGLFLYMFSIAFNGMYFINQNYIQSKERIVEFIIAFTKNILDDKISLAALIVPLAFLLYFQIPGVGEYYRSRRFFWIKTIIVLIMAGALVFFMPAIIKTVG